MSSKDKPQKMQFLGTIKKLASLFPRLQIAKQRKPPTRLDCHRTKICPNPNVLAHSKSPWTGANVHIIVYLLNMAWEKVPFPPVQAKNQIIKCSDPLCSWRFTFEKFPPPPPLLHPNIRLQILQNSNYQDLVLTSFGHVFRKEEDRKKINGGLGKKRNNMRRNTK